MYQLKYICFKKKGLEVLRPCQNYYHMEIQKHGHEGLSFRKLGNEQ